MAIPLLPSAAWQAAQILLAISLPLATSPLGAATAILPTAANINKVIRFMERLLIVVLRNSNTLILSYSGRTLFTPTKPIILQTWYSILNLPYFSIAMFISTFL